MKSKKITKWESYDSVMERMEKKRFSREWLELMESTSEELLSQLL